MTEFLERYYDRTSGQAELAQVLSEIQTDPADGSTGDPAAWGDWMDAVEHVMQRERAAAK